MTLTQTPVLAQTPMRLLRAAKRRRARALAPALLVTLALGVLSACGGDDSTGPGESASDARSITVYSGREEEIVAPLLEQFERETGIEVAVRYGGSAELASTLLEEGDRTPADVFFAQDAGALGALGDAGLLADLPDAILSRVDARFRDGEGQWIGTSGRSRVLVYNTDALTEAELPPDIWSLVDPKWKGKIGLPPTNASFQAFVTAMRLTAGEERTREWLEGIVANDPKRYAKNTPTVEAAASGEIEIGLVNHYYLYLVLAEQPDAPIANHFLEAGDPGALVNVAGAGILAGSADSPEARALVEFLVSDEGQRFYTDEAAEAEFPLAGGIPARAGLPALDELQGPDISLDELGPELEATLELLNEVGLTS